MKKSELKKVSITFRTLSSQMLKIENENEVGYITTFVEFVDSTPIIANYIKGCHTKDYDIVADMQNKSAWTAIRLPSKTEELVDYVYQILKLIIEDERLLFSWSFQYTASTKFVDKYQSFMRKTIEPFVHSLRSFLEIQLVDAVADDILEEIATEKRIFLSYCHKDVQIADLIDRSISEISKEMLTITRDVRDVKYKESIRKFMETIGAHDYVIMIVSDSYLRSQNCLYEMLEVIRDRNYHSKLLFVVLSDNDKLYYKDDCKVGADIYNMLGQSKYIKFWQEKASELRLAIEEIGDSVLSIEQSKELRIIQKIQLDLPEFMTYLKDSKGVPLKEMIDSDFKEFVDLIK